MELLYFIAIKLYGLAITLAAPFNGKAMSWVKGRRSWEKKIKDSLQPGERRILFHCPSLGEFEQGRPLLA
ncbi:MAG TPA: 3-deoxy-D-manno-octulosonic acid transferase, partial [Bacteroidia bacterium]|nr:3-deoxy-D-manno-octulosonic acid transferase [Bacteroidia bacterium]